MPWASKLLFASAAFEIAVSCVVGLWMVVALQPWGRGLLGRLRWKDLLATHIDWILLALVQIAAAFVIPAVGAPRPGLLAGLLVFGGWTNAMPYLARSAGINAFVLAGPPLQRALAAVSLASALALTFAWAWIAVAAVAAL